MIKKGKNLLRNIFFSLLTMHHLFSEQTVNTLIMIFQSIISIINNALLRTRTPYFTLDFDLWALVVRGVPDTACEPSIYTKSTKVHLSVFVYMKISLQSSGHIIDDISTILYKF